MLVELVECLVKFSSEIFANESDESNSLELFLEDAVVANNFSCVMDKTNVDLIAVLTKLWSHHLPLFYCFLNVKIPLSLWVNTLLLDCVSDVSILSLLLKRVEALAGRECILVHSVWTYLLSLSVHGILLTTCSIGSEHVLLEVVCLLHF